MCDPLLSLPTEIFCYILSYLTPKELGKCALMSSLWSDAANSTYVWDKLCEQLWYDKVYVPEQFKASKSNGAPKQAYRDSIVDSKRQHITKEELCDFVWNFRFKEAAGDHWLSNDPWWRDGKPARVRFSHDGRTTTLDGWPSIAVDEAGQVVERKWKFIKSAARKQGPWGSFLQINAYPPLIVSRYSNWGFLLQSCWVFYTSFPMPRHGSDIELEAAASEITTDTMKQEAMHYNIGVEFNLHDNAQILDLLQLLVHIHQPNGGFELNFPENGDDDDDEDEEEEDNENLSDGSTEGIPEDDYEGDQDVDMDDTVNNID